MYSALITIASLTLGAAATPLQKRSVPQDSGKYLPTSETSAVPSDVNGFQTYQPWVSNAQSSSTSGYDQVYSGQKATRGNVPAVLLITTQNSYDVDQCAAKCDKNTKCQSFAMWYERTPSVPTSSTNPNPDPAYWVKCLTYGYPLSSADATNPGQYANKFYRTSTGTGFYNKQDYVPVTVPGYDAPSTVDAAITLSQADVDANGGVDPLLSTPGIMRGVVADPSYCKAQCDAITADPQYYNGYRKACNMFNLFELSVNGQAIGYQCQYYNQAYGNDHAKNYGQYNSEGHLQVTRSWTYVANPYNSPAYVAQPSTSSR